MRSMMIKATGLAVLAAILTMTTISGFADAVGGPKQATFRLDANSYTTFNARFVGGRAARIALKGDGDTDLDLFIYDQNGRLVAQDNDNSDLCLVEWVPLWTGNFTIKVVNQGGVYNDFVIVTN